MSIPHRLSSVQCRHVSVRRAQSCKMLVLLTVLASLLSFAHSQPPESGPEVYYSTPTPALLDAVAYMEKLTIAAGSLSVRAVPCLAL